MKATKAEKARFRAMLSLDCVACRIESSKHWSWQSSAPEVHHLLRGNRLGHSFSIPLCPGHHRGAWTPAQKAFWKAEAISPASIANGTKIFERRYGSQYDLWLVVQKQLMLPADWPESKIFKRISAHV